jgi:predicted nucleic acid-binding protein
MKEFSRLYLDANIFIAIFEKQDEISIRLRSMLRQTQPVMPTSLVTSGLTLAETLVEPYRKRNYTLIRSYENWSVTNNILEVGPVDSDVLHVAAVLRAENSGGLKLPDAIHLATAFLFGCSHFLTGDMRLRERYTYTHERYGRQLRSPREIHCVRPDLETIDALIVALS